MLIAIRVTRNIYWIMQMQFGYNGILLICRSGMQRKMLQPFHRIRPAPPGAKGLLQPTQTQLEISTGSPRHDSVYTSRLVKKINAIYVFRTILSGSLYLYACMERFPNITLETLLNHFSKNWFKTSKCMKLFSIIELNSCYFQDMIFFKLLPTHR